MDVTFDLDASSPVDPACQATEKGAEPDDRALFTGLSHELCRPMISLRAGFDLLLAGCEGPITEAQREQVRGLRAQCDDLLRLTRTYLEYVGAAGRPRPVYLSSYRLGALLDEAGRQFAEAASTRSLAWSCRLEGEDAVVETDLALFQQALGQLVTSALAYGSPGGTVSLIGHSGPGGWEVEVLDDGRAVPAEVLELVNEPLIRRPDGSFARCTGDRHGMGLMVCRELTAHLGGSLSIDSEAGQGTSSRLRFPARRG